MVENMFFLDSDHVGMVRMSPLPEKKAISIERGEVSSSRGDPPNPKEYPCIPVRFFRPVHKFLRDYCQTYIYWFRVTGTPLEYALSERL